MDLLEGAENAGVLYNLVEPPLGSTIKTLRLKRRVLSFDNYFSTWSVLRVDNNATRFQIKAML
jgi:hypothetical protein